MNPALQQLQAEAQRRFGNMGGSNVGLQPNPSASQPLQNTSPANPLQTQVSQPSAPQPPNPLGEAGKLLKSGMNDEVKFILSAFKQRLNKHPVEGGM